MKSGKSHLPTDVSLRENGYCFETSVPLDLHHPTSTFYKKVL